MLVNIIYNFFQMRTR